MRKSQPRPGTALPVLCRLLSLMTVMLLVPAAHAVDTEDTRLLADPAPSADHVAFLYAGDVWVAHADGSLPKRLTTHPGQESRPRISPDGKQVAFSGFYDGNMDVFVVPVEGGEPRRLTWHPAPDIVAGFTPDSQEVLFTSPRDDFSRRYLQAFTAPIDGGFPTKLPVPRAFDPAFSEDGTKLAYNPNGQPFREWKNYRGGTATRIWIQDLAKDSPTQHSIVEVPQPAGRCNDADPMWLGGKLYFRSDRDGEFNLYVYDPSSEAVERLTQHEDFPVVDAAAGGGKIAYEQAGYVHLYDPSAASSTRLRIGIASDLMARRPRWVSGAQYLQNFALSPSARRVAFEYRGEIVTVPAEKGSVRNLTQSSGAHERWPAWSPDGETIAYFSDASGEVELHVQPQDGSGPAKVYKIGGAGFYDSPRFSPDSTKISFIDNSWSVYVLDLESAKVDKIHTEPFHGPDMVRRLHHAWSPDSQWLAYTRITPTYFQELMLHSFKSGQSYQVTEGLGHVTQPTFDASGKYLYFAVSTDAGPGRQWFAQSNLDIPSTNALYLAVLAKDEPSPLLPESDEEGDEAADDDDDDDDDDEDDDEDEEKPVEPTVIDVDGLRDRIVALPLEVADHDHLQAGDDGELFYVKAPRGERTSDLRRVVGELMVFDLEDRESESIAKDVSAYTLTPDGEKILIRSGSSFLIGDADPEEKRDNLSTSGIRVHVDPVAEWEQIYEEAWRINRDMFYDPGMHGADWPALLEKYRQFLPHVAHRQDLNRVLRWLHSELAVGHHRVGGGDMFYDFDNVPGGLLGADYEIADGKYRFKKVYGGLNWNPDLRAPLTEPGVNVQAGEYLLAVNGVDLDATENLYRRFEATADTVVTLEVGPNADNTDSRTVQVKPIANELRLRNRAWIEANIDYVHEKSGGRVAYVWVPDTAVSGFAQFERYFYPQADLDAIIVDERFNGGGMLADFYIDILRRPVSAYWAMRYGDDVKTPIASIQGPKAMLIDETAGSGGDYLPWMFRKLELGTVIGKRTWGGLVGIMGFPNLIDGGGITAPNIAFWAPEEGYGIENVGVPPHIEVEMLPAEVNAGRDPQLDKAIEVLLAELDENPPKKPERPPFPIRVRK